MYNDDKLIAETIKLYSGDVDIFISIVEPAGFPSGIISSNMKPRPAYKLFWETLKGLDSKQQNKILQALAKDKTGSKILNGLASEMLGTDKGSQENDLEPTQTSELAEPKAEYDLPQNVQLKMKQAERLLWLSVRPRWKFPPCKHAAAVHCAGVASAGITARAMWSNSTFLLDQINTRVSELRVEERHVEEKLEEHYHILHVLRNMLGFLIEKRSGARLKAQNVLAKSTSKLPGGQAILKDTLNKMGSALEQETDRMKKLLNQIKKDRRRDWSSQIQLRLQESYENLKQPCEGFNDIVDRFHALVELAETDWVQDSEAIREVTQCKPQDDRKCST